MRYFKYESPMPLDTAEQKQRLAALTEAEKKVRRRDKIMTVLAWAVGAVVFLALFVLGQWANGRITEGFFNLFGDASVVWSVISVIACLVFTVIFEIVIVAVSFLVAGFASLPFWNAISNSNAKAKKERQKLLSDSCAFLREVYGFQEPCVVTKCYDSSDKRFKDHDICLFMADGELRLTTNLQHGFLDMRRDLGCYAFQPGEIALSESRAGERQAVELRCGEVTFLLGQRAKVITDHMT